MDASEFTRDRTIDPSQLDVECVRQADRFFVWAERASIARAEVDRSKLRMDVTLAKLEIECRQKPEDFGLTKATEAGVKAAVMVDDRYEEVRNAHIRAREESGLLDAAVDAMEHKKRMIESLITLHGQQYFAGPSVPRDLVGAWVEDQRKAEEDVNDKQRRKSRKRGERT